MHHPPRPLPAKVGSVVFVASALFMIWLGTMARAYYVPGLCLLVLAALLWSGRGLAILEAVLLLNQLSAVLLLALLLTGLAELLHLPKLDMAGIMLLLHLLTGGPLAAVIAIPLLLSLRRSRTLRGWFTWRTGRGAPVVEARS